MSLSGLGRKLHQLRRRSWFYFEHLERIMIKRQLLDASSYAHGLMLDVGCGGRPYESLFGQRISDYIGLDFPVTHVAVEEVANIPVADVFGDAAHLPISSETVDTVLCTQMLEHVPEPWQVVAELARVLRPGGYLILTAPQEWGLHAEPYDFYRFTAYGLRYLVERSGLCVEYVRPRGGFWASAGQSLSSHLYRKYMTPLSRRGANVMYSIVGLLILPLCALSQGCGALLDRLLPDQKSTMGYVLVAAKTGENAAEGE